MSVTGAENDTQRRVAASFSLFVLVLVLLHLYVRTLPPTSAPIPTLLDAESRWWGLWPVTHAPGWALWAAVGVSLASLVWAAWSIATFPAVGDGDAALAPDPEREQRLLWGVAVLLLLGFCTLPVVHTRWGDAYILANGISWPDPALRLTHSWQAPLDVALHSLTWRLLHEPLGWENAAPVYRLLSPIAGAVYLLVGLALARDRTLAPGWVTLGLVGSIGTLQLFFGYIENYSFAAAGILAYLWLGRRLLLGRSSLWAAALLLAVTNATHPSTIVYLPSLFYLGWRRWRTGGTLRGVAASMALPMLALAGGTVLMMELGGHGLAQLLGADRPGGGDGRWLVPLWTTQTRWEQYTLFSWPHLRDLLNQQALVAPVVLPGLLIGWLSSRLFGRPATEHDAVRREINAADGTGTLVATNRLEDRSGAGAEGGPGSRSAAEETGRFLLLAAAAHLLLIILWNPDYGGQRDWDLFSLAAIPAALLLAWALPRWLPRPRMLTAAAAPLILVQTLHTAAWIYQNRLPWEWP